MLRRHASALSTSFLSLAGLAGLAACSESGGAGDLHKVGTVLVALETKLPAPEVVAGRSVPVSCIATYDDGSRKPLAAPEVSLEVSPSAGVQLEQSSLRLSTELAGSYQVACRASALAEAKPVPLTVRADVAAAISTSVSPTMIAAGESALASCRAEDRFHNPISGASFRVESRPATGLELDGLRIVGTKAGNYQLACAFEAPGGPIVPVTPAPLLVSAGAAVSIEVHLDQYTVRAGTRVTVDCLVLDANHNPVQSSATFDVSPSPASSDGSGFTPTLSGDYQVGCHLPNLSSAQVNLQVDPALPAHLSIIGRTPMKAIYAGSDGVELSVRISDRYDNDAVGSWAISAAMPADAVLGIPAHSVALIKDGAVSLVAEVSSPTDGNAAVSDSVQLLVDAVPPEVVFEHPARAEMVVGAPGASLAISGQVTDATSGVGTLSINGTPISLDPSGHFSTSVAPSFGVNAIEGAATDRAGNSRSFVSAYQYASHYRQASAAHLPSGRITDGLVAHLGQAVLDDGNPDADDLATIAKLAIMQADLRSLIPDPVTSFHSDCSVWFVSITGDLGLHLDRVSFGEPGIAIHAIPGGLHLRVEVPAVLVELHTSGDVCDVGLGLSGTATADRVVVEGDLLVWSANGAVNVVMPTANVTIDGLGLQLDLPGVISWAVNGILSLFTGAISDKLQSAFGDAIKGDVPPVIRDFLSSFNLATAFNLPAPISLALNVSSGLGDASFDWNGGTVGFDTSIYAAGAINPEPRGGILQETRSAPSFRNDRSLGVALSYDLINQALYSAWYGGALNLDLSNFLPAQIPAGSQAGSQPLNLQATLAARLPPIVLPTTDPAYPIELQAGDLQISLVASGVPGLGNINATIFATVGLEATLSIDPQGQLGVALGPNPRISLEIDSALGGLINTGELSTALEDAIQSVLPLIVGRVIGAIPIPSFDLSQIAGSALPPGIVLGLSSPEARFGPSHLFLEGNIARLP